MITVTVQYGEVCNEQRLSQAEYEAFPTSLSALNHAARLAIVGAAHGVTTSDDPAGWRDGPPPAPGVYNTRNTGLREGYRTRFRYWSGKRWHPACKTEAEAEATKDYSGPDIRTIYPMQWEESHND